MDIVEQWAAQEADISLRKLVETKTEPRGKQMLQLWTQAWLKVNDVMFLNYWTQKALFINHVNSDDLFPIKNELQSG